MANLKNKVNPLTWNVPITNSDGTPTNEFMRKWEQQGFANASVPNLVAGQALHTVFAASPAGPSSPPAFRLLAVADIPSLLSLYDAAGAAAAALVAAEAFSSNAANLTSNTVPVARLPVATAAALGVVKPDGVTITIAAGVISAVGGGSSGGAASIQDDGTNVYLALSDTDGQLVLDGAGDPIFMLEVLPPAALPVATTAAFGAMKPDGTTITALAGVMSAVAALPAALCFLAKLTANQAVVSGNNTLCKPDTFITNSMGAQYSIVTGKFTPTKAGKYITWTTCQGNATAPDTITQANSSVVKNGAFGVGTTICTGQCGPAPAVPQFSFVSFGFGVVDMNGTTDTLEMSARVDSTGAGALVIYGAAGNPTFGAIYIGP